MEQMIHSRYTIVLISLALCLGSPAQAQVRHAAAGCWLLSFTPWKPSPQGDSVLYRPLPDTVWLSTQPFDSVYFQAARRPNRPPSLVAQSLDSLRVFWRPVSKDSLVLWLPVWWSTGVRAGLRVSGDSLRGQASIYVDFSPYDTPYSTVTAVRCGGA